MTVAVQPPHYFPRLDYVALLQHVDHFILADTFPFRRESFQDRSKVRDAQGWHWITIPLFGQPDGAPIQEVEIETGGRWQEKHWRSFLYNYRTTMYFEFFESSFRPFFAGTWERLGPCTCRSVELVAELFDLRTTVTRASRLEGQPDSLSEILETVDPGTLITADERTAMEAGEEVAVKRFTYAEPTYRQNFESFEPGMSATDLVFNYGREAVRILAQGTATTPTGTATC